MEDLSFFINLDNIEFIIKKYVCQEIIKFIKERMQQQLINECQNEEKQKQEKNEKEKKKKKNAKKKVQTPANKQESEKQNLQKNEQFNLQSKPAEKVEAVTEKVINSSIEFSQNLMNQIIKTCMEYQNIKQETEPKENQKQAKSENPEFTTQDKKKIKKRKNKKNQNKQTDYNSEKQSTDEENDKQKVKEVSSVSRSVASQKNQKQIEDPSDNFNENDQTSQQYQNLSQKNNNDQVNTYDQSKIQSETMSVKSVENNSEKFNEKQKFTKGQNLKQKYHKETKKAQEPIVKSFEKQKINPELLQEEKQINNDQSQQISDFISEHDQNVKNNEWQVCQKTKQPRNFNKSKDKKCKSDEEQDFFEVKQKIKQKKFEQKKTQNKINEPKKEIQKQSQPLITQISQVQPKQQQTVKKVVIRWDQETSQQTKIQQKNVQTIKQTQEKIWNITNNHFLNHYFDKIQKQIEYMKNFKEVIFHRLRYLVQRLFGTKVDIQIYGSQAIGLNLKDSDIDILIIGIDTDLKQSVICHLLQLLEELAHFKWVESHKGIFTAQIPVIKLEINPTIDFQEIREEPKLDYSDTVNQCSYLNISHSQDTIGFQVLILSRNHSMLIFQSKPLITKQIIVIKQIIILTCIMVCQQQIS